jgi:NTE family protein
MEEYGIVLSGGGIKGVAHLAFLETMEKELGIPEYLSGSSAGALVAACYATGMKTKEVIRFFKKLPIFKISWVSTRKPGIIDMDNYVQLLEKHLPRTFEELRGYLSIAVVNLEESRVEYIDKGDLYPAILASCAIPFIYSPVIINGKMYADGGIMDNFPIKPLLNKNIPLYGSYVTNPGIKSKEDLNSSFRVMNHANYLALHAANVFKFPWTEHTVEFNLSTYRTLEYKKIDEVYKIAVEQMKKEKLGFGLLQKN